MINEKVMDLLRDSAEALRHGDFSTGACCCGGGMDSHGFGDGHVPVDEGDYHVMGLIERIENMLQNLSPTKQI